MQPDRIVMCLYYADRSDVKVRVGRSSYTRIMRTLPRGVTRQTIPIDRPSSAKLTTSADLAGEVTERESDLPLR